MDKYVIAPPSGSTNNSVGAADRPWKEGHFGSVKLNGGDLGTYLAESTGYGIVSGCTPTISGLTVTVGAGIVHLADGTRKEIAETNVTLDNADPTNPRIDLVYITSMGDVAKITGTAAASPVVPSVPSGGISVAQVSVAANASVGTVTDMRGMLPRWYNASVVNVKDFGAVGDGVHDDTAAIQAAIDYAENIIKSRNCNAVILVPNMCAVSTLYFSNNGNDLKNNHLLITGGGGFVFINSGIGLQRKSTFNSFVGFIDFYNIKFKSIAGNGLVMMPGYPFLRCSFDHCWFLDIDSFIDADNQFIQSIHIDNCYFIGGNDFLMKCPSCQDVYFDHCTVERREAGIFSQYKSTTSQNLGRRVHQFAFTNGLFEGIDGDCFYFCEVMSFDISGNNLEAIDRFLHIEALSSCLGNVKNNALCGNNYYIGEQTDTDYIAYCLLDNQNTGAVIHINFDGNSYQYMPLIDISKLVSVGVNATQFMVGLIKCRGNRPWSIGESYKSYGTVGSDNYVNNTEGEVYNGLIFHTISNSHVLLVNSDHIISGKIDGLQFTAVYGSYTTKQDIFNNTIAAGTGINCTVQNIDNNSNRQTTFIVTTSGVICQMVGNNMCYVRNITSSDLTVRIIAVRDSGNSFHG